MILANAPRQGERRLAHALATNVRFCRLITAPVSPTTGQDRVEQAFQRPGMLC
jgi:hypothetical protein